MTALSKRVQALLSVLSILVFLGIIALAVVWWLVRGSLPPLDGTVTAAVAAPVKVERDAQGSVTITGQSRRDVAHALGFVHGQDRFFQMDVWRRRAAGELAELFGRDALDVDRSARVHLFRATAEKALAALPPGHRGILEAYTAGVNAGLASLARKPWEYSAIRLDPAPWKAEDSFLVSYAMWFDLQDDEGRYEQTLGALRRAHGGEALDFFAPRGTSQDAPLDGSTFPSPALPRLRLQSPPTGTLAGFEEALRPGSNSFSLAGQHTASGAALLANDPHLGLSVPNVWYRAVLVWSDEAGEHRVAGTTIPGAPGIVIGSNGHIAWGYTNAYIDTSDIVMVETESTANTFYRSTRGWREIEERTETIKVKDGEPVTFVARWTDWGPILRGPEEHTYLALRWNAHDVDANNLEMLELETAQSCEDAIAIAHRIGMPNQNILIADKEGRTAWTLTGKIPKRIGYDGRLPVSWAYGDRRWDGWLPAAEIPVIASYERNGKAAGAGVLWTANNRIVGGDDYRKLGDGGYDYGFRAAAIRAGLEELLADGKKETERDLLSVQLDDRGRYLERWRDLLLATLDDAAVDGNGARNEMRKQVRAWSGHAATDSAGYRLIREFRLKVLQRVLSPFFELPERQYERFNPGKLLVEDAAWRLIEEKPARLLNPANRTWESLLLSAADAVLADVDTANMPVAHYTWGKRNTLRMQHSFSRSLPAFVAKRIDMPYDQLPGDNNMPRVQSPRAGASHRMVVSPGRESEGILHLPGGQSGHPLSPFFRAGHDAWVKGEPAPFLPGPAQHTLTLAPR